MTSTERVASTIRSLVTDALWQSYHYAPEARFPLPVADGAGPGSSLELAHQLAAVISAMAVDVASDEEIGGRLPIWRRTLLAVLADYATVTGRELAPTDEEATR